MRFLHGLMPQHDLTYNDVFMVPNHSSVGSRSNVDLTSTDSLATPLPLVVANMTAVAGRRMAETIARRGGIAIIPQDIPAQIVARTIERVKASPTSFDTAITLDPHTTIGEAMELVPKRAHGVGLVVTDGRPVGMVSASEFEGTDRFSQVQDVMTSDLTLVSKDSYPDEVFEELSARHVKVAVAVDDDGRLVGLMTAKGALRSALYRPALDADQHLMVGTAIGITKAAVDRAEALLQAGSDALVVDTAHGFQDAMLELLPQVASVRDRHQQSTGRRVPIVAGNVVTADGTAALIEAGADIVKVGVGPGAMCTTRMQTGVGRPQFSAVLECADQARSQGGAIWADGGVRYPRDVALALAAGAGSVMIGSWFAGTHEATGQLRTDDQGRRFKESFGMASTRAVRHRTSSRTPFERARAALFEEGISNSKMYLDPERPGVEDLVDFITSGVRSACTYAGAANLTEFTDRAVVGLQSPAGYDEGRPLAQSW